MPDNVIHLAPGAKALQQARAWVETRRRQGAQRRTERAQLWQALTGSIGQMLEPLGIKAVKVGEQDLIRAAPIKQPPSVSTRWSDYLAAGGWVVVLEVNTAFVGYYEKELVNPEDRTLADLVDVDMIADVAPTATIYGPGQEAPWADYFHKQGFQIWITDPAELEALWKSIPHWVHTKWHDDLMAKGKYPRTFKDVASIALTRIDAQDMGWRVNQAARTHAQFEQQEEMGAWDTQAQADIRRAIGALVCLGEHPVFGEHAEQWVEQMIPALAYSMEGKKRIKALCTAQDKAHHRVHEALSCERVEFKRWKPALPTW